MREAAAGTDARDVAELCRVVRGGARVKYLFFWGHRPPRGGRVGPGCLSQWWPARFTVDGVEYASAEHFMMAAKARLFGDAETERRVLAAPGPGAAKALGRQVRGFDEETWERERFGIVVEANLAKFGQDARLAGFLRSTAGQVLVEASPLDHVWGIGLAADDERAGDPARWRGANLLGFALMETRAALARRTPGEPEVPAGR
ncbi:NADAR family protein [Streptomyces albus subsp. chlorinus]|uniref:NADAR family protein n=1 Tax=Streptomyces albus TaxID=1888 RepID=UPI00156F8AB5|nr:NADAR family protein [Streptomyces albus]NSC23847.1 NADAR family protein [Streptomyces albus subsp. chlorinus]